MNVQTADRTFTVTIVPLPFTMWLLGMIRIQGTLYRTPGLEIC